MLVLMLMLVLPQSVKKGIVQVHVLVKGQPKRLP